MQYVIMGAGAVGSVLAAALLERNQQVEIIGNESHVDAVKRYGLIVESVNGTRVYSPRAVMNPVDVEHRPDVLILSVKAGDLQKAVAQSSPLLRAEVLVLACQNGMTLPLLAESLGAHRVAGASIGWGAFLKRPGHVVRTSSGPTVLGMLDTYKSPVLPTVAAELSEVNASLTDNIIGHLWMKLLINVSLNPVSALTGFSLGDIAEHETARMVIYWLWREAFEVARALRIPFEKFQGRLEASMLYVNDVPDWIRATYVLRLLSCSFGGVRSSMWEDLRRGKQTEVAFLNGYIVQKGEELGIPTPIQKAVLEMVCEVERGNRGIGANQLEDIRKVKIFGTCGKRHRAKKGREDAIIARRQMGDGLQEGDELTEYVP